MVDVLKYAPGRQSANGASALPLRAVELFAGVGGFRLGLEPAGWSVVWGNQWEPSTKTQHASETYVRNFGDAGHSNADISKVLDSVERRELELPDHDLVVGGFPCQDYSVARPLNEAAGLVGKKGVLWWQIYRLLRLKQPKYILLENVDRLLKSPASQRGRDFAVMLASLAALGYTVEWRVINSADYGFPQRRRRVFIVGEHTADRLNNPTHTIFQQGVLGSALPAESPTVMAAPLQLDKALETVSASFGKGVKVSYFKNAGVMQEWKVWTANVQPTFAGAYQTLGDILLDDTNVPDSFFVHDHDIEKWRYFKGAKAEPKKNKAGFEYTWTEGAIPFPDTLDKPSRTILTGEGGSSPSRFKHILQQNGRLRRLTPVELERLNGFPDDWTTGHSHAKRAFLMGNALVVGIVERIAKELATRALSGRHYPPKLLEKNRSYRP